MANPAKGLGKGLGALLGNDFMDTQEEKERLELPISQIENSSSQPRKTFDPEALEDLAESIRIYGEKGLEVQITEMAVRNYEKEKAPEHAAFYARLFTEVFLPANAGEKKPLTAVCIWGLVDAAPFLKGQYTYSMNSPYGCFLDSNYKIKTCFAAVYNTLKGE